MFFSTLVDHLCLINCDFPKYLSPQMNLRVKKKEKTWEVGKKELRERREDGKVENLVKINRACSKRISRDKGLRSSIMSALSRLFLL